MVLWKDKTDKPLARLTKEEREGPNQQYINEKGDITTDMTEIQRIVRGNYEQLRTNKPHNLEKNEKILRNIQSTKIESERNWKSKQTNY